LKDVLVDPAAEEVVPKLDEGKQSIIHGAVLLHEILPACWQVLP
jgi:hypothetical protein